MGPRSDERGRGGIKNVDPKFTMLQWGRVRMNAEGPPGFAWRRLNISLQWGRVRMNAEGPSARTDARMPCMASMGPRSDERGRWLAVVLKVVDPSFNGA